MWRVEKKDSYFLLSFTEEDELETTTYFCEKADDGMPKITSYPSGGVAVVTRKSITLIQGTFLCMHSTISHEPFEDCLLCNICMLKNRYRQYHSELHYGIRKNISANFTIK